MTLTLPPASQTTDREAQALFEEAHRRRRRRRLTTMAIAALVLALVAGLLLEVADQSGGGRGRALSLRPARVGTFSHPTGVVLAFADGLSLDLDHRNADVRAIRGQRAGDQQWDVIRSGGSLVVGWGEVWATPFAGGPARLLGPVVTFVPASEAGAVWLVDYPGGRIGEGTPTLREVTVTGSLLRTEQGPPPDQGLPVIGIPGGLAFETSTGVAFWNASRHTFTRRLGSKAGFIGDAAGGRVAWCEGNCTSLHVTVVRGSDQVFSSPQSGQVFEPNSAHLSPDGRYVAVITTRPGLGTANQRGSLDIVDTLTGRGYIVRRNLSLWSTMAWTADGRRLFFASDRASGMTVGQFQLRTGRTDVADVAIKGAEPFVVLSRSEAGAFLSGVHKSSSICQAQLGEPRAGWPKGIIGDYQSHGCTFSF